MGVCYIQHIMFTSVIPLSSLNNDLGVVITDHPLTNISSVFTQNHLLTHTLTLSLFLSFSQLCPLFCHPKSTIDTIITSVFSQNHPLSLVTSAINLDHLIQSPTFLLKPVNHSKSCVSSLSLYLSLSLSL